MGDATALRQQQQEELRSLGGWPSELKPSPMSDELDMLKQKMQAKRASQPDAADGDVRSAGEVPPVTDLTLLKQSLQAKREKLTADADERYATAEELLRAGDDEGAR